MTLFIDYLATPLGSMQISADEHAVKSIYFVEEQRRRASKPNTMTDLAVQQLNEYFNNKRQSFDLPLAPEGTAFQQEVWQALLTIEHGKTCSYSDIAGLINKPKAMRAVGAANGRNPLTIVVPCHRVIGRNGALTGYAFGLERKVWLLEHESKS